MNKNRILSLLAAFAIIISAFAPSPVLAEGGWGEAYPGTPADQQFLFVPVHSAESASDSIDAQFEENDVPEAADEDTAIESELSPAIQPVPATSSPSASDGRSASKNSSFQLDGKALVKYLGSDAYVFVPEDVTVIRGGAFAGTSSIVSVYLPDSVREIEGGAFENCSHLQTIVITGNSNLSTIGAYAFAGCLRLNISFSLSVQNVSARAFPPELISTPTPEITPTPKPTPTMKPTPARPSTGDDNPGGAAVPGSLRIVVQPVSVRAKAGDFVTFIVVAEGRGTIYFQWMRSKDGVNWMKIENSSKPFVNASTNVLSFTATAAHSGYLFKCIVSDGVNTVESDAVSLIVDTQGAAPDPGAPDPWDDSGSTPGQQTFPSIPDGYSTSSVPYLWAKQIGEHSALITWTEMQSAIGYELYRYSVGYGDHVGEEFILLGTFTGTSYTDTNLDFAHYTYTYSLKAVLSDPHSGNRVTTDYSNPAVAEALSAPSSVSAWQETETTARITWSPSKYATSYMVTRSTNNSEFEILVQSLKALEYVDQNLDFSKNTYRYIVWAEMTVPGGGEPIRMASVPVQVDETFNIGREFEIKNVVYTITRDGAVVTAYKGNATSLTIPSTIQNKKYTVIAIGPNVFWGNKTLKTIILPKTIRVIETGAFAYCSASIVIK